MYVDCRPRWEQPQAKTNVFDGQLHVARTLATCQEACFNNASCTGVDWDPGNPDGELCWFSGPWSRDWNIGGALGVTHYNLTRICGRLNGLRNLCLDLKFPKFNVSQVQQLKHKNGCKFGD